MKEDSILLARYRSSLILAQSKNVINSILRMFAFILLDAHKELRTGSVRGVRKRGERMLYGEQGTAE